MVQVFNKTISSVDVEIVEQPIEIQKKHRVGLIGGTFNPPHIAHLMIADQVGKQLGLDHVEFIPDYLPPHVDSKDAIEAKHRVEMVRLAIEDNPMFQLNLIEIERGGKSFTYNTIQELKRRHPETEYYFIIGGDMVQYLPKWHKIKELSKMVNFVGVERPKFEQVSAYPVIWVDAPNLDLSSTDIRNNIKHGRSIKYLVPKKVEEYIKENSLYGYK
ncbi:nicotinate-nucleotide adenylyltransferase [Pediococcus claussenii]|uniref:Probable nicotinate-nucleotide adenylyltransferase n=1 Tax=Pediococcus claussenii (strain ATCC BAA-344 / DSM 14800 / JCM 18046 / KCTC 3811 / LMG 21948 / P06) TaxID=701521 RepID=G8PDQ4_PEDCP|nr:nicotinate-nucleotide adenylyltransferase [Pediococcus claussenii]AEV95389.1 nicotinate (nicotinamide) nucleotide adenylyltransferase [Pediococcus claussenii ATCC BAA-344]ANZ68920.1 nicotinate-nicotinamide nucleotide adenylyltransferase [Pediococcus claussenii]ANZ70736.1 nicotinate-nicotinamide nucleotide adenylyltransferase [Pediococcus claussenii]KRN19032.1 nadD protein [Pediococcus claussenii]